MAQATGAPSPAAAPSADDIKQREQELEAVRAQQKSAAEVQEQLKADIAAIGQDRSKLNQQLIDIAAAGPRRRNQDRGRRSAAAAARRARTAYSRLARIRGAREIVEVLAALQRAGRRAPPALLVRPEDALQSLRTAMLLGSVVPEMRARAEKLVADLGELVSLRKSIAAERDRLAADRDKLKDEQTRLASLVDERQRQQSTIEKDMAAEGARAITLSHQVDSLQGLIAKMEQDLEERGQGSSDRQSAGRPGDRSTASRIWAPSRIPAGSVRPLPLRPPRAYWRCRLTA